MQETFFIPKPVPTGVTVTRKSLDQGREDLVFPSYQTADGRLLMWSGDFDLPEIGQRIYITMNGIGWAIVVGYFECEGYLGVMTKPTKPPKWLRKRNREDALDMSKPEWYRRGIGCEYGTEIALTGPRKPRRAA